MEKSPEQKSSPESQREVATALRALFYTLKEHMAKLTSQDMDELTRQFTQEVDEYLSYLLESMKRARSKKREAESLARITPGKKEKMDAFTIQKFIKDEFVAVDKRTNRNFSEIKKFFEQRLPGIIVTESPGGTVVEFKDSENKRVFLIPYINTRVERAYIPYFPSIRSNYPVIKVLKMAILDTSGGEEKIVQIGEADQTY